MRYGWDNVRNSFLTFFDWFQMFKGHLFQFVDAKDEIVYYLFISCERII